LVKQLIHSPGHEDLMLKIKFLIMKLLAAIILLFALFACSDKNMDQPDPVEFYFDFTQGANGWTGDFADYPVGEENFYELVFEHATLPEPLDQNQFALKLSGSNHSDRIIDILENDAYLAHVAKTGAEKARESASKTLSEVKEVVGFKRLF